MIIEKNNVTSFAHTNLGRPKNELSSPQNENQVAKWKTKESVFERQEQILAEVTMEIQKNEFQADFDERSVQGMELLSLSEEN